MKPVKNEIITYRTDAETKRKLQEIADSKRWSLSLLTEIIIQDYLERYKNNDQIDS